MLLTLHPVFKDNDDADSGTVGDDYGDNRGGNNDNDGADYDNDNDDDYDHNDNDKMIIIIIDLLIDYYQ